MRLAVAGVAADRLLERDNSVLRLLEQVVDGAHASEETRKRAVALTSVAQGGERLLGKCAPLLTLGWCGIVEILAHNAAHEGVGQVGVEQSGVGVEGDSLAQPRLCLAIVSLLRQNLTQPLQMLRRPL